MDFKKEISDSRRRHVAGLLREKNDGHIPVVIKRISSARHLPELKSCFFLFKNDISVAQIFALLRSKLNLKPEEALFLVADGFVLSLSQYLCELYEKHRSEDDILYLSYGSENVFGQ